MNVPLIKIFGIFFYIGIQLLGGGYVIVPLLKKHIVDDRKWMSEDELVDFYAMSQCIPGIIACNIATSAGYKIRGVLGALAALSGIVFPAFLCILLLANIISGIADYPIIQSAFKGIRIAVVILVLVTIRDLWKKSINTKFAYIMFFSILITFLFLNISPTLIIIISAIIGLSYTQIRERVKND